MIYLVRHGQASYGAENYDKLSEKGELQAQFCGEHLSTILKEAPYVVAGSMVRHQQTAQFALSNSSFKDVMIHTDPNWNEFNHVQVFEKYEQEHKGESSTSNNQSVENPRAHLAKIFTGAIDRWVGGQFDQDYDESWPIFKARVEKGLDNLYQEIEKTQPRYAVVFTSGGVISVVTSLLLGLPVSKTFELNWAVVNTSLTTLRYADAKPHFVSFNEHQFIKSTHPELLTWI